MNENPSLLFFNEKAPNIANVNNYPPIIKDYLFKEREFFINFVKAHEYKLIIEAGCMDGQLLMPLIISTKTNYLGIDLNQEMSNKTNNRIGEMNLDSTQFALAINNDITNLPTIIKQQKIEVTNSLVVFPFNSFGHIIFPLPLLKMLRKMTLDVLILSYNATSIIKEARYSYYKLCGCTDLNLCEDKNGALFLSSEHLHAYGYFPHTLSTMLEQSDFISEIIPIDDIGFACHGSRA